MKKLMFVARFPGPIQGHAINAARRFFPRLCADYEFEDLLQEAYLVFMKCKRKYAAKIDNPKWFMAIFRVSLHNHFINLTKKCGLCVSLETLIEGYAEPATEYDASYFRVLLKELPEEVRTLLASICNGQITDGFFELLKLRVKYPKLLHA